MPERGGTGDSLWRRLQGPVQERIPGEAHQELVRVATGGRDRVEVSTGFVGATSEIRDEDLNAIRLRR